MKSERKGKEGKGKKGKGKGEKKEGRPQNSRKIKKRRSPVLVPALVWLRGCAGSWGTALGWVSHFLMGFSLSVQVGSHAQCSHSDLSGEVFPCLHMAPSPATSCSFSWLFPAILGRGYSNPWLAPCSCWCLGQTHQPCLGTRVLPAHSWPLQPSGLSRLPPQSPAWWDTAHPT